VTAPAAAATTTNNTRKPRILCVDDEPQVLDGLSSNLRRRFEVHTALGGKEGLALMDATPGGFAVVMSDMRMPHMSGAAFLAVVRQRWPATVRLLLTGQSELEAAIAAVNEGQIFRFLNKPCPVERLIEAVEAGVEQHRLIQAEKVLLEQTLHGSIKALTDILSLQNPAVFGRATRAKAHVAQLAQHLGLRDCWALEVAAMLSPIATVTLPPETAERLYESKPLSPAEQAMVKRLPAVTEQLLANIPRLEPVREILAARDLRFDGEGSGKKGPIPIGARLLKIALDYDALEAEGLSSPVALDTMRGRKGVYDPDLVASFASLLGGQSAKAVVQELPLASLRPGMTFLEDVRTVTGGLLVAHGHEVTASLIERIRNFSRNVSVKEPLRVQVPAHMVLVGDV
jgi:response regulator RpfG family c-di-GMP phosphodiesterase